MNCYKNEKKTLLRKLKNASSKESFYRVACCGARIMLRKNGGCAFAFYCRSTNHRKSGMAMVENKILKTGKMLMCVQKSRFF